MENKNYLSQTDGEGFKFKHETLLNYALNRWGLNKAYSVGALSELIRECSPKELKDWEEFYFTQAKQKKKDGLSISREYITELGKTLYIKLSEVVQNELLSITEEECIDYVYNLVIRRTYDGYKTEIDTIYGQLENILGCKIEPAPDKWDRTYSVDFFIKIGEKFIGIQIKPVSSINSINQYQWEEINKSNHQRFEKDFGGKVFFIYSTKVGSNKRIHNVEVIDEIQKEMERLER